jgi:RNase P protein component
MNDEEIRKLLKQVEAEFRALDRRMSKLRESRFGFTFTKAEKKAWSRKEPDFHKRIIKA